jgi:hypothetical protein
MSGDDRGRPRLAELVAALSLAPDLGLGQPMEHVMRSCLVYSSAIPTPSRLVSLERVS